MTDGIKRGEVKVAYFPMENMLADFFTKPLQRAAFRKMREIILNLPSTNKFSKAHRSVLEKAKKMMGLISEITEEKEGKKSQ